MEPSGSLTLRYAVATDVGQRREANEDSVYTSPRLLAVADGMGGHVAGEVASSAAIAAITELDRKLADADDDADTLELLGDAVSDAVDKLTELALKDPRLHGMGTTLTTLLWDGSRFGVAQVGDSRAYRLRAGELEQITRDHTVVQELVDQGRITPEAAITHPSRSVLTRALQSGGEADPDLFFVEVRPGDRYLICSDGLSDVVPFEILAEILAEVPEPPSVVQKLVELANAGGGPDNITCVVADIAEAPAEDGAAGPADAPEETGNPTGVDVPVPSGAPGAISSTKSTKSTNSAEPADSTADDAEAATGEGTASGEATPAASQGNNTPE
ncbi:PP2C family protein-serine/threonine phosphatase [Amycolatopsis sp.]|uniref:PP2C family protein-serine/threonine phosphatase n=1 Tax=Amycolatopsis sp. TaxID=37632 RepID=UPI002BD2BC57|nr:protein phosphatase 2C domain-containing protein [Amycolatopsis sp.]HVV12508.1 protein phosphatase 2C domain-containing protein [Amycolatopsis sp.]